MFTANLKLEVANVDLTDNFPWSRAQARSKFQGEVTSPQPAKRAKFQIRWRSALNRGRSLTLGSKDGLLVKLCLCNATVK